MEARFITHPQLTEDYWGGFERWDRLAICPPPANDRHPILAGQAIDGISLEDFGSILDDLERASQEGDEGRLAHVPSYFDTLNKSRGTARLVGIELFRRGGFQLASSESLYDDFASTVLKYFKAQVRAATRLLH